MVCGLYFNKAVFLFFKQKSQGQKKKKIKNISVLCNL